MRSIFDEFIVAASSNFNFAPSTYLFPLLLNSFPAPIARSLTPSTTTAPSNLSPSPSASFTTLPRSLHAIRLLVLGSSSLPCKGPVRARVRSVQGSGPGEGPVRARMNGCTAVIRVSVAPQRRSEKKEK